MGRARPVLTTCIALALSAPAAGAYANDTLGAWRDYAVRGITPDFSWATPAQPKAELVPTVLSTTLAPRGAFPGFSDSIRDGFSIQVSRAAFGDGPAQANGFSAQQKTRAGLGLDRTFITPSLTHSVDESTSVTGSVILAQQQFATFGFGFSEVPDFVPGAMPTSVNPNDYTDSSAGAGVRVAWNERLSDTVGFLGGYQSQIDMQAFQNYRGVFADPGDFDVPAVASAGLSWSPVRQHRLGFSVQRVMYSDVATFTSASLPRQFLSVLGDSDSPTFSWEDLTIYGLDYTFFATPSDAFQLRYATRMQPMPSNDRLRAALESEINDHNFAFMYVRDLLGLGSVSLAASYAPSQYFLGNWSNSAASRDGDQIEVEAVWTIVF